MKKSILILVSLFLFGCQGLTGFSLYNPSATNEEETATKIYEKTLPAVVNIISTGVASLYGFPIKISGNGSGLIINKEGHILTNYHVISSAKILKVMLAEGNSLESEFIAKQEENDLAVIKVKLPSNISPLKLGDSDKLKPGQTVFAIGNPFGLQGTITKGIISFVGRNLSTNNGEKIEGVIQIDAPINPGNSGGPLLDIQGKVIGINNAVLASGSNIGFAIPINIAKSFLKSINVPFEE